MTSEVLSLAIEYMITKLGMINWFNNCMNPAKEVYANK